MATSRRQAAQKRQRAKERRVHVAYQTHYQNLSPNQELATADHILRLPEHMKEAWLDKYPGYMGDVANYSIERFAEPPSSARETAPSMNTDTRTAFTNPFANSEILPHTRDTKSASRKTARHRKDKGTVLEAEIYRDIGDPSASLRPPEEEPISPKSIPSSGRRSYESLDVRIFASDSDDNAPQDFFDASTHQQSTADGESIRDDLQHKVTKQHQSGSPNPVPCYRCEKRGKILGCYGVPRCERCKEKGYSVEKCQGIVGREEDSGNERPAAVSGKADKGGRRLRARSSTKPYPLTKRNTVSKKASKYLRGKMWEVEEIKSHKWENGRLLYEIVWADKDANGNKYPNSEQGDYQVSTAAQDEYWASRREERDVSKGWPKLGWRRT